MRRDDHVYVRHILDAVDKIRMYVADYSQSTFLESTLIQDGVIRQMEIMGEASRRISPDTRMQHPDIPWREMAAMRNKLIHDYFGIDLQLVWTTVQEELPKVRASLVRVLKDEDDGEVGRD